MHRIDPDESLSRELRNRSIPHSWDGQPIWDARWDHQNKKVAIVQRRKPEPGYPLGRWTIWNLLKDDAGQPRNIERRDINLINEHVYGGVRKSDDWEWYKNLESEEFERRVTAPERELDDGVEQESKFAYGFAKPKFLMGTKVNKRFANAQRRCPHNEWMVECNMCSPNERRTFSMAASSGEANVRTERGNRGSP